jgi:hypothetical protein
LILQRIVRQQRGNFVFDMGWRNMKTRLTIVAVLSLSAISSAAMAVSLNDALDKQTKVTITPVKFGGLPVIIDPDDHDARAGLICKMLGYPRLVEYFSEPKSLDAGEAYAAISTSYTSRSPMLEIWHARESRESKSFLSITCAY